MTVLNNTCNFRKTLSKLVCLHRLGIFLSAIVILCMWIEYYFRNPSLALALIFYSSHISTFAYRTWLGCPKNKQQTFHRSNLGWSLYFLGTHSLFSDHSKRYHYANGLQFFQIFFKCCLSLSILTPVRSFHLWFSVNEIYCFFPQGITLLCPLPYVDLAKVVTRLPSTAWIF